MASKRVSTVKGPDDRGLLITVTVEACTVYEAAARGLAIATFWRESDRLTFAI